MKRALALRKPLLFVDVSTDHKRNGIGKLIGFSTKGTSDGYLVVPVAQPNGKTLYHMYVTSNPSQFLKGMTGVTASGSMNTTGPTVADDHAFAASLASNITAAQKARMKVQDTNSSIQPVQHQWLVTNDVFPLNPPTTGWGVTTPQGGLATVTVTYTLFQDLSTNLASGGTQVLVMTTDASGDPGPMVSSSKNERAWFMGAVNIWNDFTTPSGDNGGLTFFKAGPIAENQSNTYSSGTSFNIGLSPDGPSGGFGWDSSQSHNIPDWSVSSDMGYNNLTSWRFKSSSPNIDDKCTYGFKCAWYGSDVTMPNALSTSLSQYHTEAVYHNTSLSTATIDVESNVVFWLYDMYYRNLNNGTDYQQMTYGNGRTYPATIDLSSVVPQQPTITYNYPTAPTNNTAVGSISFPNPVTGDQTVYLKALGTSNTGITVPGYVLIPAGERTASFPISINNDQSSTSVTVQANFGQYSRQVLLPVAQTDFTPPAYNLTFDPDNWAATVSDAPATSGWKTGNLVRYAVSYIDGNGKETTGPYSDWAEIGKWALPYLVNLPTSPSGTVWRRVYRQFYTEAQNGTPGHVISPDANGNSLNATYPSFRDGTW